jgi:hypothetical protein
MFVNFYQTARHHISENSNVRENTNYYSQIWRTECGSEALISGSAQPVKEVDDPKMISTS